MSDITIKQKNIKHNNYECQVCKTWLYIEVDKWYIKKNCDTRGGLCLGLLTKNLRIFFTFFEQKLKDYSIKQNWYRGITAINNLGPETWPLTSWILIYFYCVSSTEWHMILTSYFPKPCEDTLRLRCGYNFNPRTSILSRKNTAIIGARWRYGVCIVLSPFDNGYRFSCISLW